MKPTIKMDAQEENIEETVMEENEEEMIIR